MTYKTEFPDFDYELPVIPGFVDQSWHNDVCPSLVNEELDVILWCDYADASKREMPDLKRFHLIRGEYGVPDNQEPICESDDLADIFAAIETLTP